MCIFLLKLHNNNCKIYVIMKKKLTRSSIDEIRKEMLILNSTEERKVIGGGNRVQISGGYLEEKDGGTYFYGNNGGSVFFSGISISTSLVADNAAYQMSGTIHVSESWANNGFSVYDFAHEYGHYLQQVDMGTYKYITDVAIPSVYSASQDPSNHSSKPYEQQATNLGNQYLENNWRP